MERLTEKGGYSNYVRKQNVTVKQIEEKLGWIEDLEEQGLILKLPCKCDEVVWVAEKGFTTHKALYSCPSAMLDDVEHGRGIGYTKAEAEKALEEMEK